MPRFLMALRLVRKLKNGAANQDLYAARGALGGIHFDIAVVLSADEHDVLLSTEVTAANI